jgi:hypothetical protein
MSSMEKYEPIPLEPATASGEIWERLKGESRQAFANFAYYRDLGRERNLVKAAQGIKRSRDTLKIQSAKYRWQDRVTAYDDYLDRRLRSELETARTRVNEDHMALARRLQLLAGRRLLGDNDPRNRVFALNPNDLEAMDTARIVKLSFELQRVATGQPTDYVAGKFGISADDLLRVVQGLYEIAENLVEPERRGRLAMEFQAFLERGGRAAA